VPFQISLSVYKFNHLVTIDVLSCDVFSLLSRLEQTFSDCLLIVTTTIFISKNLNCRRINAVWNFETQFSDL